MATHSMCSVFAGALLELLPCMQEDITKALRAVHARFFLSATCLNLAVVGPGLVGGELLDQMQNQCHKLQKQYKLDVRVLAIASSKRILLSDTGVSPCGMQCLCACIRPARS